MNEKLRITNNIDQTNKEIRKLWNKMKIDDINEMKEYWNDDIYEEFKNKLQENEKYIAIINENLNALKNLIQTSEINKN